MKKYLLICLGIVLAISCGKAPAAIWTEGPAGEDGKAVHTLELQNIPAGARIWFQEFYDKHTSVEGPQIQHYQGTSFYVDVPEAGNLTLRYSGRPLTRRSWAPEGFAIQQKGKEDRMMEVKYNFLEHPAVETDASWYEPVPVSAGDIIPALKNVEVEEGEPQPITNIEEVKINAEKPEGWYRIEVEDGKMRVEWVTEAGLHNARATVSRLGNTLPEMEIEDWPDFSYRGFMLDVVRDFRPAAEVKKVLDILAAYKVNTLHFHLGDDESWCLEIKALPDLTSYGAHHALPDWDLKETQALKPTANGRIGGKSFYTQEEYKDILVYAWDKGIAVIPEFDTPGHSRASIRAMEAYERRTGDSSFRLQDPADTSKYWTAQDFTDNVLSVELPSVYKFYGVVFDEVKALYEGAGVPLKAIHIGGDEVPVGAWGGGSHAEEKEMFIKGMLDIAEPRGIKLAGWQELADHLTPETTERLKKNLYFLNAWGLANMEDRGPYKIANAGFPIVLTCVTNCYLDLAYDAGFDQIGLNWGGYVDERRTFALQPWKIYESVRWHPLTDEPIDVSTAAEGKTALEHPENVLGVQAALWSENNRSLEDVEYQMLPKGLGSFERAWNSSPVWSSDEDFKASFRHFYSVIREKEMPAWDKAGYNYKKR